MIHSLIGYVGWGLVLLVSAALVGAAIEDRDKAMTRLFLFSSFVGLVGFIAYGLTK